MQKNITLPADANEALRQFTALLEDKFTLLMVLGDDKDARDAFEIASRVLYTDRTVLCILAKNPAFILEKLKRLQASEGLEINWNNNYLMLSISNKYNNIGEILTAAEYKKHPNTYPQHLVVCAEATDLPL